jgi:hypothetical protein
MSADYLTNGIDSAIVNAVVSYLQGLPNITQIFPAVNIYNFNKLNIPNQQMPAINVFVLPWSEDRGCVWHDGTLVINMIIPIGITQDTKLETAMQAYNELLLNIKQSIITTIQETVGGIWQIGWKIRGELENLTDSNKDRSELKISMDYTINLAIYQNWLYGKKSDFSSPDIPIYENVETISLDVEPE